MFAKKPNPEVEELNAEITRVITHMRKIEPTSEEYSDAADQLVKLYAQKKEIPSDRFSKDQVLLVAGNVSVALLVIAYEQKHVWTTKVFDIARKAGR